MGHRHGGCLGVGDGRRGSILRRHRYRIFTRELRRREWSVGLIDRGVILHPHPAVVVRRVRIRDIVRRVDVPLR